MANQVIKANWSRFSLSRRQQGISLVELLVGIGMIVLLMVISLPAYTHATHLRDQSICASHLREIGVAIFSYANDRGGLLPGPMTATQRATYTSQQITAAPISLLHYVAPYLGLVPPASKQTAVIFECPAQKKLRRGEDDIVFYLHRATILGNGVSQRPFGYMASGQTTLPPLKLMNVVMPGKTVALFDTNGPEARPEIHGATRNVLFMDGHTERIEGNRLVFDATTIVIR